MPDWTHSGDNENRRRTIPVPRSDGAPERRWRRTLELRKRPATLNVRNLLQDFGYSELSPGVAAAVETRLASVGLKVEPPLAAAALGDIILITHGVRAPEPQTPAPESRAPETMAPDRRPERDDPAPRAHQPPVDAAASQRIMVLERELADARSQIERLRVELEERPAPAESGSDDAPPSDLARQRAGMDARRERAQVIDVLHQIQIALMATRSDIRHCSESLEKL